MKFLYAAALIVLLSVSLQAQPTITLEWDQPMATPAEAQAYVYTYYLDNAAGQILNAVVCGLREAVTTCSAAFPSPTIGLHTVSIDVRNAYGVSPRSVPLQFRYPAIPGTPQNLRFIKGDGN